MYQPPVRIDPHELRPRLAWLVGAGLLAGFLLLGGVGGFVWAVFNALGQIQVDKRFDEGQTVTIRMLPDVKTGIFAEEIVRGVGSGETESVTPVAKCAVTSPAGQVVSLQRQSGTFSATVNGVTWAQIYVVGVPEAGDYQVTCQSNETTLFGVGKDPDDAAFAGWIAGAFVALFVLPLVGLGVAVITAIVVGRRRRDHRNRLIVERATRALPYGGSGALPGDGTALR